jgi:putative ABC transport system permease protein
MKLTAKLAFSQLNANRKRTIWTILGIILSAAMLTAVCGFVVSAKGAIEAALGIDEYNSARTAALIALGALFGLIIMTAAVVVVSNAFRVSAGERIRQFGILKSVGATKKQITQTILYESVFLSAIAIPIGLILGLLIEFVGTFVVGEFLNAVSGGDIITIKMTMPFVVNLPMFAVAVVTSFGTVLLSAWLPARKAAKIPATHAIRATGDIKIKRFDIKTSKLTQKIFGFEGTLALRSLKRNRRNFRATVVSLTMSIVLLIIAGSLSGLMKKTTNLMFPNIDATAVAQFSTSVQFIDNGATTDLKYQAIDSEKQKKITERLRAFDNSPMFAVGSLRYGYNVTLPAEMIRDTRTDFEAVLITIDSEHYARLCEKAKVTLGSNILINNERETVGGKKREFEPFVFIKNQTLELKKVDGTTQSITIDGQLTAGEIPNEIMREVTGVSIIVPETEAQTYYWFSTAENSEAFAKYADTVLAEEITQEGDIGITLAAIDIRAAAVILKYSVNVIMFFVYGFVGLLTLIALTNVISTIGANVRSRSSEFAVLESVGMTKSGLRRMLNLESILCSARSLLFGVPLGVIGAYAAYRAMGLAVEVEFSFPWFAVCECVVGVFVVTWVTMRYAASRLKNGSIVGAIRE